MSTTDKKTKKKLTPKPEKGRTFKAALESTNKKYSWTLAKLAK